MSRVNVLPASAAAAEVTVGRQQKSSRMSWNKLLTLLVTLMLLALPGSCNGQEVQEIADETETTAHRELASNVFLTDNQIISQGETLAMSNGAYLKQQNNGNLVLYNRRGSVLWENKVSEVVWYFTSYETILQGDGNLITRSRTPSPGGDKVVNLWTSKSAYGSGNYALRLDGNGSGLLILRTNNNKVIWSTSPFADPGPLPTPAPVPAPTPQRQNENRYQRLSGNIFLTDNQVIEQGQKLGVSNGIFLKQESNGALVLYDRSYNVIWQSGLDQESWTYTTYHTVLKGDGELITRSRTPKNSGDEIVTRWSSNSGSGSGDYALVLNDSKNGLLIVRKHDGHVAWSTPAHGAPVDFPTPQPTPNPTPLPTQNPTPRPSLRAGPVPQSGRYSIEAGPMIGHTTSNSVTIWLYQGERRPVELVYWPTSNPNSIGFVLASPIRGTNGAAFVTIEGLNAYTDYSYEARINNEWIKQGQFRTAPRTNRHTQFKYMLASCMDANSFDSRFSRQPVWHDALRRNPDFALLPGDTIYLNYQDWNTLGYIKYERVWYRPLTYPASSLSYLQQRREKHFADFIKSVPTYGAWDNHDYGWGWAEQYQLGKETSLAAWKDLWPNPYDRNQPFEGNFYTFDWGDADFFVLDGRWYRDAEGGRLFGDKQIEWLGQQLKKSTATFKIIISSSDVMARGMTYDVRQIGKIVKSNRISGVLFNSGDIHRNEFKKTNFDEWPYPVVQITSSGIAQHWRRNYAMITVDTGSSNPSVYVEFYSADSSGTSTSWSNESRRCSGISGRNRDHESNCSERVYLRDLRA
eukprot:scaffold10199_cov146-Cylindrotheca_fusiformis.AAC.11